MKVTKMNKEKWFIIGASRGLGAEFVKQSQNCHSELEMFLASRKINRFDTSNIENYQILAKQIVDFKPDRLFYFPGGGPYGAYQNFQWKDHEWSFNVTFKFPAFLLHYLAANTCDLKQVVLIGSAIAESNPDPYAAMYCASKHALKGLVSSLQKEGFPIPILLFSPGYIETELLPKGTWPRQSGLARPVTDIAAELLQNIK